VVFADMRFIGQACLFESDAGFLGGVPSYVVHYAGTGSYAVEQILDGSGDGERGLVVQA